MEFDTEQDKAIESEGHSSPELDEENKIGIRDFKSAEKFAPLNERRRRRRRRKESSFGRDARRRRTFK